MDECMGALKEQTGHSDVPKWSFGYYNMRLTIKGLPFKRILTLSSLNTPAHFI